ncbi:MAG: c-type cytochrome, partial [Planctomycetota bacterium]|nr:c-type cytochrome [Planctomycetota bacterium]
ALDTPPTDLVRGTLRYRSTPLGTAATRADVARTIQHGLPGGSMPALAAARPAQVAALIDHLVGLGLVLAPESAARTVPPVPALAVGDRAAYDRLVLRGRALYAALECSRCHGSEGRGDGSDAVLEWSDGRRVRARDFKPRDARDVPAARMRTGATPEAIWRVIMNGLDARGMPGVGALFDEARGVNGRVPVERRLVPPLFEPELAAVGVVVFDDGPYEERLEYLHVAGARSDDIAFGDDWALVLYVLHLLRSEADVARDAMAWPQQGAVR